MSLKFSKQCEIKQRLNEKFAPTPTLTHGLPFNSVPQGIHIQIFTAARSNYAFIYERQCVCVFEW